MSSLKALWQYGPFKNKNKKEHNTHKKHEVTYIHLHLNYVTSFYNVQNDEIDFTLICDGNVKHFLTE